MSTEYAIYQDALTPGRELTLSIGSEGICLVLHWIEGENELAVRKFWLKDKDALDLSTYLSALVRERQRKRENDNPHQLTFPLED